MVIVLYELVILVWIMMVSGVLFYVVLVVIIDFEILCSIQVELLFEVLQVVCSEVVVFGVVGCGVVDVMICLLDLVGCLYEVWIFLLLIWWELYLCVLMLLYGGMLWELFVFGSLVSWIVCVVVYICVNWNMLLCMQDLVELVGMSLFSFYEYFCVVIVILFIQYQKVLWLYVVYQ